MPERSARWSDPGGHENHEFCKTSRNRSRPDSPVRHLEVVPAPMALADERGCLGPGVAAGLSRLLSRLVTGCRSDGRLSPSIALAAPITSLVTQGSENWLFPLQDQQLGLLRDLV